MTSNPKNLHPAPPPLVIERYFSASVDRIYELFTQPKHLQRWFHPGPQWTNPGIDVDLRIDGRYRLQFMNTETQEKLAVNGRFLEISKNQRLVYTWEWEPPKEDAGIQTRVTIEFSPQDRGTHIRLTHDRFTNETWRNEHEQGWLGAMACLDSSL